MKSTRTIRRSSPFGPTLSAALLLASACGGPDTVTIGAVLPLSGPSDLYGQQIAQGIELAYDELRASPAAPGGIHLKVVDSASDPEIARQALEEVYEDGARAAIGGVTAAEAQAMIGVAEDRHRVLLSPWASAQELTSASRGFYRLWPSDAREGSLMGQFAAQKLGAETATVLAAQTPYADSISGTFLSAYEENGGKVLEVIRYPAEGADAAGLARRAAGTKAEAIYLADYAVPVVGLIQELDRQRYRGRILTVSAFATPRSLEAAGRAAEGVFVTHPQFTPDDEDNPQVKAFVEAYRRKFGETPGLYAAHGYDSMRVIVEALNRGGESAGTFWKGMRSVENLPGVTGPIQFDERGEVLKYPRVYVVQQGRTVDYAVLIKQREEQIRARMEELRRQQRRLNQQSQS